MEISNDNLKEVMLLGVEIGKVNQCLKDKDAEIDRLSAEIAALQLKHDSLSVEYARAVAECNALASRPMQSDRECAFNVLHPCDKHGRLGGCAECAERLIAAHVAFALRAKEKECGELREMLQEAIELLDTSTMRKRRDVIHAPEDAEIKQLCDRVGYGAVLDSACRQWQKTEHGQIGAHTVGHCFGTIEPLLTRAQALLSRAGGDRE